MIISSEQELKNWIRTAEAGDNATYHRGFLARDRDLATSLLRREKEVPILDALATYIHTLWMRGLVLLVQQRHGPLDFAYEVVRTRVKCGVRRCV